MPERLHRIAVRPRTHRPRVLGHLTDRLDDAGLVVDPHQGTHTRGVVTRVGQPARDHHPIGSHRPLRQPGPAEGQRRCGLPNGRMFDR